MSVELAARYVGLSPTTLRQTDLKPKRHGKRVLYDKHDLDRWADQLNGQPLDLRQIEEESELEEQKFLARRKAGNDPH